MSGQRTVTINCLPRLTQTRRYQDGIICGAAANCGTDPAAEARRVSPRPMDCLAVQGAVRTVLLLSKERKIKQLVLELTV